MKVKLFSEQTSQIGGLLKKLTSKPTADESCDMMSFLAARDEDTLTVEIKKPLYNVTVVLDAIVKESGRTACSCSAVKKANVFAAPVKLIEDYNGSLIITQATGSSWSFGLLDAPLNNVCATEDVCILPVGAAAHLGTLADCQYKTYGFVTVDPTGIYSGDHYRRYKHLENIEFSNGGERFSVPVEILAVLKALHELFPHEPVKIRKRENGELRFVTSIWSVTCMSEKATAMIDTESGGTIEHKAILKLNWLYGAVLDMKPKSKLTKSYLKIEAGDGIIKVESFGGSGSCERSCECETNGQLTCYINPIYLLNYCNALLCQYQELSCGTSLPVVSLAVNDKLLRVASANGIGDIALMNI